MDKYLLEILKEVNTIIIPGLGAFTITDSETGDIMFMPYLKHDDGELSKYIANKEGIEVNDATNLIAKYVREISITLDKGESYDMYQFGSFTKDDSGDIKFQSWNKLKTDSKDTPSESSVLEPEEEKEDEEVSKTQLREEQIEVSEPGEDEVENIYIPPAHESVKVNLDDAIAKGPEPIEEPISQPETKKLEVRELNILEKEERAATQAKLDKLREEQNKPKKKRGVAFYLMIFIGFIVIAFSSYVIVDFEGASKMMPFLASAESKETKDHSAMKEMSEKEEANTTEVANESTDTITIESSESEEVIEEPVIEVPVVEEPVKTPVEVPVPTNSKVGYHIIAGAFGNLENAERFAAKLRSEGASASLIQENGFHKVSLGSFNTRDEAKSALSSMNLSVSAIIHKVD